MKKILILFIIFNCTLIHAQTINGIISDAENNAVANATVLIKKANNPNIVFQYTLSDNNGHYSIQLPVYADSLLVEVSSISYESFQENRFNLKKEDYPLQIDFILLKRAKALKEIIIHAKEKPIKVKNDTTIYNPNSFRDGTEKVIEDLLKKLPGIKVESNGEIKFKGKSIKKMLLDGDDLFDSQYVVGSKNINIDLVENIQAIENFNENPLFQNISESEDVALNIKLKKGKTDFSGNVKLGYGLIDQYDSSMNGLLLNSKNKSFGLVSHNNIGINTTPYNFQSDIITVEEMKEEGLLSKELIRQGSFNSKLDDDSTNLNNNFYANFNSLQKFSKGVTGRLNFGFYDDRLTQRNSLNSVFTLPESSFVNTEQEFSTKEPLIIGGNFQFLNKKTKKSNWEYLGKFKYQQIDFSSLSTNNGEAQNNKVQTRNFFTKHTLNFTTLINQTSVLMGSMAYSKGSAPQNYQNTPGVSIDENAVLPILENKQTSSFTKEVINVKLDYISTINKFKMRIQTGFHSVKNDFTSLLTSTDSNNNVFTNDAFKNNFDYSTTYPFANVSTVFKDGDSSFKAYLATQYFSMILNDGINISSTKRERLTLSGNLKFLHNFSNKSKFVAGYSYTEAAPLETNAYTGIVQTGFRSFQNNETNLAFSKTHAFNAIFNYNDLFNLKRFQALLNYNHNLNHYLNKTQVSTNTTTTTSFLAETPINNYTAAVSGEKYLHFLRTTLQLNCNYNLSFYNDIVNGSDLREVETKHLVVDIILRTGFKTLVNFEAKTNYNNDIFVRKKSESNKISTLNQSLKITYNKKNITASGFVNAVSNNLSSNHYYLFVNAEINYTSKNKKIEYAIMGRNLTNNTTFESVTISDYYRSTSSEKLINRYIMFSVSFKI